MKNDFKVNFYDNKKIWDKIPINFNEPMHINEAIARGLHIRGLKSYYEIIQKNPKIKTYTNISKELDSAGNEVYIFNAFPVSPEREKDFLNAMKTDSNLSEKFEGRNPYLDSSIKEGKTKFKQILPNLKKVNFKELIEEDKKIFIKNQFEIENKINNAVKNNNAELVNSLYVKKFNNSSFKNTQLLNNKLNKIKSEEFKPSWKLKYEKVQKTLQQELQKSQVKKAADVGTNTESGFVGIKPVIKVTNPEGTIRKSYGPLSLVMSDKQLYTDRLFIDPLQMLLLGDLSNFLGGDLYDDFSKSPKFPSIDLHTTPKIPTFIKY